MIRHVNDYRMEQRPAMRGGDGTVTIRHFYQEETELKSPTRLFAELTLPPGASIGFHTHDGEEEIFVVLAGHAEINDNGVTELVAPGDTIRTGDGAGHAVRNVGDSDLKLLAVIVKYN